MKKRNPLPLDTKKDRLAAKRDVNTTSDSIKVGAWPSNTQVSSPKDMCKSLQNVHKPLTQQGGVVVYL